MTWLRTAWAWTRGHAWLAVAVALGALASLWRWTVGQRDRARRERDAEAARADAARASADRERRVQDAIRVIETRAGAARVVVVARQAERHDAHARDAEVLREQVETSGSAADEVNRRMDKRGGR